MPSENQEEGKQKDEERAFHILIDRVQYKIEAQRMTGAELRMVPTPPIGPDRDLWQIIPGASDRKIENTEAIEIHNGERFFTAPAHINPGSIITDGQTRK
jgi:hypothetical protein